MRGRTLLWSLAMCAGCSFDASGIGRDGGGSSPADAGDRSLPDAAPDASAPDAAALPEPIHLYLFDDGTADDSAGDAHGTAGDDLTIEEGAARFGEGEDAFVELPAGDIQISGYEALSFEAWFRLSEARDWQRIFEFGAISDELGARNLFFTPTSGFGDARAAISNSDPGYQGEVLAAAPTAFPAEEQLHVVVTLDETSIRLYRDGELVAAGDYDDAGQEPPSIGQVDDSLAFLGRSLYSDDPLFAGSIDEFAIYDVALTGDEVAERFARGPAE